MDNIKWTQAPPHGGGFAGITAGATAPVAQAPGNPRRKPENQSVSLKRNASFSPPTLQHAPLNPDHAALLLQQQKQKSHLEIPAARSGMQDSSMKDIHPMASVDTEHSSGTDSNIKSNPDDWYTSWNTRVKENNRTAFKDDDPPYYLAGGKGKKKKQPQQSSSDPKTNNSNLSSYPESSGMSNATSMRDAGFGYGPGGGLPLSMAQGLPFRQIPDDSLSDSGSFRSVIDDLTIKNQKLKKRLKKLERLHCNDQGQDKLFEVRVHGLSLEKKKELHDLLQRFAATLNVDSSTSNSSSGYINSSVGASPFTKTSMNPPSSVPQTAPTDSAYATDSRISSTPSNAILPPRGPAGARLPLNPLAGSQPPTQHSSEKSKMKTVVRRLEHLFTGREALRSALAPSVVQQDIANEAAQDDRMARIEAGEPIEEEGPREAQLMTWQQDKDMADAENAKESRSDEKDDGLHSHLDQRPTRPLDLDPQRSQVPADNVVYLEHMTLSLQDENANFIPGLKDKASNWVYLNLITNLAQLHTLNVTVPFIKRAIQQYSNKLELSSDGKKIRWKGGNEGTKLSSDGSRSNSSENSHSDKSSPDDPGHNARVGNNPTANSSGVTLSSATSSGGLKNASGMNSSSMNGGISADLTGSSSSNHSPPKSPRQAMLEKFKYKPLLGAFTTHRGGYEDGTDSDDMSSAESLLPMDATPGPPPILDTNASPQPIENLKKMAPIDGPVIYFGASFCIDLSSQIVFSGGSKEGNNTQYYRHSEIPIGPERPPSQCSSIDRSQSLLFNANGPMVPAEYEDFDVDMDLVPMGDSESHEMYPRELEVSGLGGVRPEDNFMMHVRTSHEHPKTISKIKVRHVIPQSALDAFFQDAKGSEKPSSPHRVLSIENKTLEPSKLPSPSYGIFSSSSEESEVPATSGSESRVISDSDVSYNFPIDLDSRSEADADEDVGAWMSSGDHSKMELDNLEDNLETQQAASTAATAGGSFNGDASPIRSETNPKSVLLKPMDHLSLGYGIGIQIDSPASSESSRIPLKRAHESSQDVNAEAQKPPTKMERIEI